MTSIRKTKYNFCLYLVRRESSPLPKVWLIFKIVVKQIRPLLCDTLLSAVSFSNIISNTILLTALKFPLRVSLFALQ